MLYEKVQAFQSEDKQNIQPCNQIKNQFTIDFINDKNWWYYPKCKIERPDIFSNVQVGRNDRFCVNVTIGIPFYRTAKSKTD